MTIVVNMFSGWLFPYQNKLAILRVVFKGKQRPSPAITLIECVLNCCSTCCLGRNRMDYIPSRCTSFIIFAFSKCHERSISHVWCYQCRSPSHNNADTMKKNQSVFCDNPYAPDPMLFSLFCEQLA